MRVFGLGFGFSIVLGLSSLAAGTDVCLDCHEADAGDTTRTSFALLPTSTHASFDCIDCHISVDLDDHPSESARHVECATCHSDIYELYEQGVHFRKRNNGASSAPSCYDCHGIHNVRSHDDPSSPTSRLHIPQMCAQCHSAVDQDHLRQVGEQSPYDAYKNSIHGKLILEEEMEGAAVCSDCHEPHRQLRRHDPKAAIYKANIPATCGQCHEEITEKFQASVHGQAVLNENFDAPVCTDCHAEHNILASNEKLSQVYGANISRTTCLDCHKTLGLATDRGFYEGTEFSYNDSYHGAASRSGVVEVANCASCHGIHDILPSSDPNSSIHIGNLPNTCGQCHPAAGEHFAMGSVHRWEDESAGEPAAAWVRYIYIWLIVLVLGGMLVHNGILFGYHLRYRHHHEAGEVEYLRFTRGERWQHWVLAFLFIGLVITGFAYRFPESWWSSWWVGSSVGFQVRDILHRLFGALFGVLMLYHIGYTWFTKRGRLVLRHLWPTLDDAKGVWQNLMFHLGRSGSRMPVKGLFDYAEKAEYWALVWGSWIMLFSGIPMWFENWALALMPLWLLDVFKTVHFYEAILASAAIVIWHFYFVIFDPEHYPLNMSMITGRARPRHGFELSSIRPDDEEPDADKKENDELAEEHGHT